MGTSDTSITTGPGGQAGPAQLLADAQGLRARARTRLGGSGVPLLAFGLLGLAAVPFAHQAFNFGANARSIGSYPAFAYAELTGLCVPHAPDAPCLAGEFDGATLRFAGWGIWFAVLPLAWLALARWYRLRGEERGIVPRRTSWIAAALGAAAVIVLGLLALLVLRDQPFTIALLENSYASPWYAVGIGLLVLGLVERDPVVAGAALAHTALLSAYLGASWDSGWIPWVRAADTGWSAGPQLKAFLLAAILLSAGLARLAAARRRAAVRPGASSTVGA
ncbi:hypothetical protein ACIGZJ_26155 [Kitasatospora sp. NPDC052868]|uniref:hypothetical protein n=1 Tax=Kitasatospora sp. NPDC052868 TaxID=3364060 RepID=UPI0037CA8704